MNTIGKKILSSEERDLRAKSIQQLEGILCSLNKDSSIRLDKIEKFSSSRKELEYLKQKIAGIKKRFELQNKAVTDLLNQLNYKELLQNFEGYAPPPDKEDSELSL